MITWLFGLVLVFFNDFTCINHPYYPDTPVLQLHNFFGLLYLQCKMVLV